MIHRAQAPPFSDIQPADPEVRAWWTLAALALLLRFMIMPYGGFPVDIGTFKAWATNLADNGPAAFYGAGFADYLPGYLYVLWIIGEVNRAVRLNDWAFLFALKLPAVLADVGAAWLIFATLRRFESRLALPLAASYLFNPGIVFNSAFWGQADAVAALFSLTGVASLGAASPVVAAMLLMAGALIKPQTSAVLIPAGLYLLRTLTRPLEGPPRWDLVLGAAGAAIAVLVLIILPFGLSPIGLLGVLRTALGVYPFSSVVAFNLWGAAQGFWQQDSVRWLGVPLYAIGTTATLAALAAVAAWAWKRTSIQHVFLAAAAGLVITFTLPTRIHERYLLPSLPFLAIAAGLDRRLLTVYAGFSLVFLLNLIYAYTRPYAQTFLLPAWIDGTVFSDPATRVYSAVGVALLGILLFVLFTKRRPASAEA
jgi:Gpi18-like mannosyltransferase